MKILFIACYSPFINNSAAIETLQYLNKLSSINGNEVHLLTVDFPKDSIYYDEGLSKLISPDIKVNLIEGGIVFKKLMLRKHPGSDKTESKPVDVKKIKLLRSIKNALVIPDMYKGWAKNATKVGKKIVEEEKIDVIISMHEPPSSHLCALYIKKQYKSIPWITYWSDPWLKDSTRKKSNIIKKTIEKRMEKQVIALSDRHIFVTEANRQDYIDEYNISPDKASIITRGFDKIFFENLSEDEVPEKINKDKINIIYTGEIFSELRDIRPFIRSVESLKESDSKLYEKLNIIFFGNIDDAEAKEKLESLEVAQVNGRIPFNEAIKYMLNSDILLLFGNKNSKQIPAKIYEYFGATGKILVIYGDDKDPIKKLVENNEKCICVDNKEEEIEKALIKILASNKNKLHSMPDYRYEWSNIIDRLNKILEG